MLGYGEEVAKEKIRCKYLPSHSHSFSKEQNLHLLESADYAIFKALSETYYRQITGIEDVFYAALA